MNSFLYNQLERKVEKFFEGKSDLFVVYVTEWFSFGDGPTVGKPDSNMVSPEDFDYLVNEIIGKDLLGKLVIELSGKNKYFSAMESTEKNYLSSLNHIFMEECYQRLRKNALKQKIAENEKSIKKNLAKVERIKKQIVALGKKHNIVITKFA